VKQIRLKKISGSCRRHSMAGSAIMIASGAVRTRVYESDHTATPVDLVTSASRGLLLVAK